jgi:hypothetical protein
MDSSKRNRIILTLLILLMLGGTTLLLLNNQIDPAKKIDVVPVEPGGEAGVTRVNRRQAQVAQALPELELRKLDGTRLRLAEFPGKVILLQIWRPNLVESVEEIKSLREHSDYFHNDPRFMIVTATADGGSGSMKMTISELPTTWTHATAAPDASAATKEFLALSTRMIVKDGQIIDGDLSGWDAFALASELLPRVKPTQAAGTVIEFEQIANQATDPLPFKRIPAPSGDDAATGAKISVVDGRLHGLSGKSSVLNDGRMPQTNDSPGENFFFIAKSIEGRFIFDFERIISVGRINSYTWHGHDRSPQVFRVYGSDGTAANFNVSPKFGVDPLRVGWTLIADVNTHPAPWPRGVTGISIHKTDPAGNLGQFRYLLFLAFPAVTKNPQGHTFFGEIDVVEAK